MALAKGTLSAEQVKNLSDDQLDKAYAAAFDNKNVFDISTTELEILDRLQNVWSFATGLIGNSRFPMYDAKGRFKQSAEAQASVKENAVAVVDTIEKFGGKFVLGAVVLAVAFMVISIKVKGK